MVSANAQAGIRLETRRQLRKLGYNFRDIRFMMDACDSDLMDAAVAQSGQADALAAAEANAAASGGTFATIVAAIIAFLQSPQGQALIAALIKLLIASLSGA